jgi:PAS domain S-box-containing protein
VRTEIAWWRERIHPEDRDRVIEQLRDTIARRAPFFLAEFRFRAANGTFLALFDRSCITYDDDGQLLRKIGALMDVTRLRRPASAASATLSDTVAAEAERRFLSLIDNLHIVVFQTDREGRLTCVNKAWSDLTGWTREESVGRYFVDVLSPELRRVCADELTAMVMQGREWRREDVYVQTPAGERRLFDVRVRALSGGDGHLTGACGTLIEMPQHVSLALPHLSK